MLFASLINHLAVQQIREPHGNLISHGKGEEERTVGKREPLVAGSLYFISSFFLPSSGSECVSTKEAFHRFLVLHHSSKLLTP